MYRIKLHGLGGQGVVTAAKILAHAVSIHENKFGKTVPAFGHERRGAPVFADVMIDDQPVLINSFVYEPDVVVLFAPSVMDQGISIAQGIHHESILVINTGNEDLVRELKEKYVF
ncbi:MAG: 2-oxoacid:acceptor oxidoreductase family protein, partial [Acidobacteria bacterium]|nr:2-oxoacid:acceptor oxidoreductase family protein [Acidobacteriota bacterium]